MTELILTGLFLTFISVREWMHAKEVKLLSEAIIAKNIYEYKEMQVKPKASPEEEVSKDMPIEDITDEAFLSSIRKQLDRETPTDKFKNKIKKAWPIKSNTTLQK
ncbi:hypothetical protein KJ836_02715 [Patescibacteria group bacterium]|nr:hypothetical protein [Patescibacteria group bacterium]